MFLKSLLIGCIGLSTVVGTALATGNHEKKDFKPCKLEVSDSPKIHNPHCKTPTPSPKVTPTPTATPKSTPTSVSPTPVVTPSPAPSVTPAASQTVKSAAPAILPSVGGSGKLRK